MVENGKYVEMAIEEMTYYEPSTPERIRRMELDAEAAVEDLQKVVESTRMQFYYAQVREIVEEHYDIGKLLDMYQIYGGYVNITFGLYTEKDGQKYTWIMRKYRRGKTEDALKFEHKLLKHARDHGFTFCAVPIQTRDNKTYVCESVEYEEGAEDFYFAIFNYIEGERQYDWMPNWAEEGFQETTLQSAALSLAEFHSSTTTFDSGGLVGDNLFGTNEDLNVNNLIATFPERMKDWSEYFKANGFVNKYSEYLDSFFDFYAEACKKSTIPDGPYQDMVVTACHLDFHGGNFKYYPDGTVSGSFDYDMAMVDSRLFDIALGMHYTFASWKLRRDGELRLDRVERFIKAYNEACKKIGIIEPLNQTEKEYFYEAMLQAPIYVYGWANGSIRGDLSVDPFEYLYYAMHFQHSIEWLEEHEAEIRELGLRL